MRIISAGMAAALVTALAPDPAAAMGWVPIRDREAGVDIRIDGGERSGALTKVEAAGLRADVKALERLEVHYRFTGNRLSLRERADLDRRFAALSRRIHTQKQDARVR